MKTYNPKTDKTRWYQVISLNRGIILSLLIATIVPMVLMGIKLYHTAWTNAWEEIDQKHLLLAKNLTSPVSIFVSDQHSIMNIASHDISEYINGLYSKDEILHQIKDIVNSAKDISAMTWVDAKGNVQASFTPQGKNIKAVNYKNNIVYQKMSQTKKWKVFTSHNEENNHFEIQVVEPIFNNKKFQGVLIGQLDKVILQTIRSISSFGYNGYAYIVDSDGHTVSHPKVGDGGSVNEITSPEILRKMAAKESGVAEMYSNIERTEVFVGFAPVPGMDWWVVVQQPKAEVRAQISHLMWSQVEWAMIGILVVLVVALYLIHWVNKPLHTLMTSTASLIESNLKGNIPPVSKNAPYEIQKLAMTMNMLASGFRASQDIVNGMNESLQAKVAEATQQLRDTNEQLECALEQANEASKAKGSFLANMSHELRTPMNAIIGYSEILREEAEARELKDLIPDICKIQTSSNHLLALISDILDLSKIEAGKMDVNLESFHVRPIVEEVLTSALPLIEKNKNELVVNCRCNSGNPEIYADQVKFSQIILNLLSNAAKFTTEGKIEICVKDIFLGSNAFIEITVKDNGIGMDEEQVNKIFGEFTQADSSTTKKYGGTGLGLTISQRFCHMMGGDISVTSEPGKGTSFTVLLPANVEIANPLFNEAKSYK